jgi:plastocyanin
MISNRIPSIVRVACLTVLVSIAVGRWAVADEPSATVVVAKSFMFSPMTLTVAAGTTVTWSNSDDEPHTVVSETGLFRSPAMDTNESFSFRFDQPGSYRFICSIHPQMTGTVIVQ